MTYREMIRDMNELFKRFHQRGVMIVGETEDAWIVKGYPHSDLDTSVIVDKKTGEARWLRMLYPEHRRIAYNAKIIDIPEDLKVI